MPDAYLRAILENYKPNASAPAFADRLGVHLKRAFPELRAVTYSGSYAKGTAVSVGNGGSDVDLFLSFPYASGTLRNLYAAVYDHAASHGWKPRQQNVSIGLRVDGYKVDLVPARIQDGYTNYHSLFVRKAGSWRQTNVQLHAKLVRDSGRTEEIRVLKIWRTLHDLDFPSFYLELVTLEALKGRRVGDLANNVSFALEYLRDHVVTLQVVDPANDNNVVSDTLDWSQKSLIARAGDRSRQEPYWKGVVW